MLIDRWTGGRLWPEHGRFDLMHLDAQIERVEGYEPGPMRDEALRLLHEARDARMRQLRAMVLED